LKSSSDGGKPLAICRGCLPRSAGKEDQEKIAWVRLIFKARFYITITQREIQEAAKKDVPATSGGTSSGQAASGGESKPSQTGEQNRQDGQKQGMTVSVAAG